MKISFLQNSIIKKSCFFEKNSSSKENEKNSKNGAQSHFLYFDAIKNYNIPFLANLPSYSISKEPIYAIDVCGNYKKYINAESASKELGVSEYKILKCASGKAEHAEGLTYAFASNIEKSEDKVFVPDKEMIELTSNILKEIQDSTNPFVTLDEILIQGIDSKITRVCDIPKENIEGLRKNYLKNPFYVMDENEKYRKFYNPKHVAEALNVDIRRIRKCISGKSTIEGFAFIRANEIEKQFHKVKTFVDLEKLKSRFKQKEGFYAVDIEGNYQKFDSAHQASDVLNVPYNSVTACLSKKQKVTNGYVFLKPKELEIENQDGETEIDTEKINNARKLLQKDAIYLVNDTGYKRYDSYEEASKAIGASTGNILQCLYGYRKTVGGYTPIYASKVERFNKEGVRVLNIKKLQDLYLKSITVEKTEISENGFYAINKKGEYQKFYKLQDAENALGIVCHSISKCINGVSFFVGNYVFARAEDIEVENQNGEMEVDTKKIKNKLKQFERRAFYAIDKNAKAQRFTNQNDAAQALKIPRGSIAVNLAGKAKTAGAYVFVRPEVIEIEDENGEITLNEKVIKELAKEITKLEIYAIDRNGKYQKFLTRTEAVKKLGVDRSQLCACLCGRGKTAKGYVFANASEIEIEKEGEGKVVDEDKIREKMKLFS